ncbi:hypothetical protein LTR37_013855 [Vermiconidia calcicola]|uniref:Uncharacterized protein n=1 Tax=Vermiconidia calcicola TaxID=1690605 RepID=A0ACC3MWY7_9PEZI|nr:hypothetical protein LTR37_013855 [Vermiconidia calcicola]
MPKLKQINCSIELGPGNTKLKEYGARYSDGYVEAFIAVPDTDVPFTVHLKSEGYIAPGLAFFVFMDGVYQCNRNRIGLKLPDKGVQPKDFETEFRLRQKEEKTSGGSFVVRDWTFAKLDRVAADKAPKLNPQFMNNIGTIEIVALRCKTASNAPPPQPALAPPKLPEPKPAKATKAKKAPSTTPAAEGAEADGGMFGGLVGLFDGASDGMHLDGAADERPVGPNGRVRFNGVPDLEWDPAMGAFLPRSEFLNDTVGPSRDGIINRVKQEDEGGYAQVDGHGTPNVVNPWVGGGYGYHQQQMPIGHQRNPLAGPQNAQGGQKVYNIPYDQKPMPFNVSQAGTDIEHLRVEFKGFPDLDVQLPDTAALERSRQEAKLAMNRLKVDIQQILKQNPYCDVEPAKQKLVHFEAGIAQSDKKFVQLAQAKQQAQARFDAFKNNSWTQDVLEDIETMRRTTIELCMKHNTIDPTPILKRLRTFQLSCFREHILQEPMLIGEDAKRRLYKHLCDRNEMLEWFEEQVQDQRIASLVLQPIADRLIEVRRHIEAVAFSFDKSIFPGRQPHAANLDGVPGAMYGGQWNQADQGWAGGMNNQAHPNFGPQNPNNPQVYHMGFQEVGQGEWDPQRPM